MTAGIVAIGSLAGRSLPPKDMSGVLRRLAFKTTKTDFLYWLMLWRLNA